MERLNMDKEKIVIYEWEDIRDDYGEKLILGNGASMAIWEGFSYKSLLQQAEEKQLLDRDLVSMFDKFHV